MKHKTIFLILALFGITTYAATEERINTTARLPQDTIIWPLDQTNTPIAVECEFSSEVPLILVKQGNWEKTEKLVVYDVTRVIRGEYPYKQITFICNHRWPTPESGIEVKAIAWPFGKGTRTFYLTKEETWGHEAYFNISAY